MAFAVIAPTMQADAETPATETRYTGGHIVATHGSADGGSIDAIQLEFGSALRAADRLARTAADLAEAIRIFSEHYGPETQIHHGDTEAP